MDLEFVDHLPKSTSGRRKNSAREHVLVDIVDTLAGDPGEWARYPWQQVRPDLADVDNPAKNKRVQSHFRQIQTRIKQNDPPFHEYDLEFTVRGGEGYIRVAPLPHHQQIRSIS